MGKPELVAPAGKTETFFAALEAGADAVYLGLEKFNARLKAGNFILKDLARLVPFAQARGRKVFVTLNTLIKQAELGEAVSLLAALDQLRVDAVILADLGLTAIARDRFPGLRLHASTQMGIHSSAGVRTAERIGLKRVILARELTREEIGLIRRRSGIELEVFVHGALCYSLSGFCLASSFVGGKSGNRGLCTQVCRRAFRSGKRDLPFFSPRDLELLDFVPALSSLGIDAFKIEGRLKGSSYVRTVVSAYRQAIDHPASIPDLRRELERDGGRKKTSFFFDRRPEDRGADIIQAPDEAGAVGEFLGKIIESGEQRITFRGGAAPAAGDAVRIQPADGFEGKRAVIARIRHEADLVEIIFHHPVTGRPGDAVFLVDRKAAAVRPPAVLPAPRPSAPLSRQRAFEIVERYLPKKRPRRDGSSFSLVFDSLEWLEIAAHSGDADAAERIVLSLDKESLPRFPSLARPLKDKIRLRFPLFIPETEIDDYRKAASQLTALGFRRFQIPTLNHLFPGEEAKGEDNRLDADASLSALNVPARVLLRSLGLERVAYPLEDDFLNIRNSRAFPAALVLFGLVPLFVSRVAPALDPGAALADRNDNRFLTARRGNLHFLLGKDPVCLFQKREKLEELGVREFVLDFSFFPPVKSFLKDILSAYHKKRRILPSTLFNFKRELA